MYDEPLRPRPTRFGRLSFLVAGLAAVIGLAAFGVAIASGGQPSNAGLAIPLVSNASPAPGNGPGAGPRAAGGWMAPGGIGAGRGFMMNDITITAISGTSLSLRTADGWTRTIDASGATVTRAGQTVALSTLRVGDQIVFGETRQSDGSFRIGSITVVLPQVGGTVAAKSGDTLTVKDRAGTSVTVRVTSSTTFQVKGVTTATIADVAVGDVIQAEGTRNGDGSITATIVRAGPAGQFGPGPMMRGPGTRGPGMRGPWGAGGQGPAPTNPGGVPGSNGGTSGTTGA